MECPSAETLACYGSDALDDIERAAVAAHADDCQSCRRLLSRLIVEAAIERTERGESASAMSAEAGVRERSDVSLRPGDMVSRYRIVSRLGRGAMGTVYCAFDEELERDVALKLTTADFRREAKALAQLDHENVVTVFDVGEHGDHQFIAMQLIAGIDLAKWLTYRDRSAAEIVDAICQVADGLAAAHEAGIVHRDVKPENILIAASGKVAIGDFGLAVAESTDGAPSAGTPVYMAPEVLEGNPATAASDQFSLAVTLYEALTGSRPHTIEAASDGGLTITDSVDLDEAPIQPRVQRCLERALSGDPSERFDSLTEFAAALRPKPAKPRSRWPLVAAVAVGVSAVGFISMVANAPRPTSCEQAGDVVGDAWNQLRAVRLQVRHSGPANETTIRSLESYAKDLREARVQSCTDKKSGESLTLIARRNECLDARQSSLAALTTALEIGDTDAALRGPNAARGLPPLAECLDAKLLAETSPLPSEATARKRVVALRSALDAVDAALALGDETRAAKTLERDAAAYADVNHAPTRARYQHARAEVLHRRGELEEAEEALREGIRLAAIGKDDVRSARLWLTRAGVVGYKLRDTKRALAMLDSVRAAVARAGSGPELEANLANTEGLIYDFGGDFATAATHYQRAHDIAAEKLGPDHPRSIATLRNLAIVQNELGKAEAKATWDRVLEKQRRVLGDNHPDVARTIGSLARMALRDRDFATATRLSKQALDALRTSLGEKHPSTLLAMQRLASVHLDRGQPEEALVLDRQVLETTKAIYGEEHPRYLDAQSDLMGTLRLAGKTDEAVVVGRAALAAAKRLRPDDTRFLGRVTNNLANALADSGALEDAIEAMTASLGYKRKTLEPSNPSLLSGAGNLAELLCNAKRYEDGMAATEGALEIARELESSELGWLHLARSSCLVQAGRGKAALREARAGFEILYDSAGSELERGELKASVAKAALIAGDKTGKKLLAEATAHLESAGAAGKRSLDELQAWARRQRVGVD